MIRRGKFAGSGVRGSLTAGTADPDQSMIKSIAQWVEKGNAPEKIIATKYKAGGNPASGAARIRPLCPNPMVATYSGSGSMDEAANFSCAANRH
jgi:feruloyl esterase